MSEPSIGVAEAKKHPGVRQYSAFQQAQRAYRGKLAGSFMKTLHQHFHL
jgi:hypothetical protein